MPKDYYGVTVTSYDLGMSERLFRFQWEWYQELLSNGVIPDGPTPEDRRQQKTLAAWKPYRRRLVTVNEALRLSANALRRAITKGHAKVDERGCYVSTKKYQRDVFVLR